METRIVEINGIKMEVDMRTAKVVHDNIRVGTKVKLLLKQTQYGSTDVKVYPGVVVGFENFTDLPSIIICYLECDYSSATLKFAYLNKQTSEKYDVVVSVDDELPISKADVLSKVEREIAKKREEIIDLELKRDYFLRHFNRYFENVVVKAPADDLPEGL